MRRAVLTPPIPLTPALSPSDGEREKARRAPCHSIIQRQARSAASVAPSPLEKGNAETLVRSEKACETGGESPLSLEAKPPEFRAKVMNGKV